MRTRFKAQLIIIKRSCQKKNAIESHKNGGAENLHCALTRTAIAAGLWGFDKRPASPISEHSCIGGFDAHTEPTTECERQFSSMNRIKAALRNRLSNDFLHALMKINCACPADYDFDPGEAVSKRT